jgi:hypothetical protein
LLRAAREHGILEKWNNGKELQNEKCKMQNVKWMS